jgi:hypothetical protein
VISPADPVNLFNFNQVALEAAVQSLPAVKLISIVDPSDKQVILSIVFN